MRQRPIAGPRRRAPIGAFRDYVRSVFAECSARARLLRASRASWLHRLSRLPARRIRATNLYSRD
jgi:hypothetical protein